MRLAQRKPLWSDSERELTSVRVYDGMPNPTKDPAAYSAQRQRVARWQSDGITPTLRYPGDGPRDRPSKGRKRPTHDGRFRMGFRDEYDVAIIASTDADFCL